MLSFDAGVSHHRASVRGQSPAASEARGMRGLKFLSGVADTLIVAQGSRHGTKQWMTSEGGAARLALATTWSLGQERSCSATGRPALIATLAPTRWCERR